MSDLSRKLHNLKAAGYRPEYITWSRKGNKVVVTLNSPVKRCQWTFINGEKACL